MNPKLFGAIVIVGASLGASAACRTQILPTPDLASAEDMTPRDQGSPPDQATVDLGPDLKMCCFISEKQDLAGCGPITCMLI